MIKKLFPLCAGIGGMAIRLFPVLVILCILAIPAYKRLWIGYVPVISGAVFTLALIYFRRWIAAWLRELPAGRFQLLVYTVPALIQVALILVFRASPQFDGFFVFRQADALAATGRMDPMTYYPPGQTWWYALWFVLVDSSYLVAQLSQVPLSVAVTWATYKLAQEVTRSCGQARWVAVAVAWYPSFLMYVLTTPYYHYLYTFFTLIMTWGVLKGYSTPHQERDGCPRLWPVFVAGLAAGAGALTKAVQLIAPVQIAFWLLMLAIAGFWKQLAWRRVMISFGLFIVGMMLVVGPWMWRNMKVFDAWVPVCTSGGLVLFSANNPHSNGLYSGIPDHADIRNPAEMLAHARWCSEQAKSFMLEQPRAFFRLMVVKFLHTWGVEATFTELINWRGEQPPWMKPLFSLISMTGWSALAFGWIYSASRAIRRRLPVGAPEWWVGVLVLSNALVYVVFEGGDRHHLPLVPLILVAMAAMADSFQSDASVETTAPGGAAPKGRRPH